MSAARAAADEFARIAAASVRRCWRLPPRPRAVLLPEGGPRAALGRAAPAVGGLARVGGAYEAARARELIGIACRALGDPGRGPDRLDEGGWVFRQLGARPIRPGSRRGARGRAAAGGLRAREVEVLRLVAAGKTNRAIAEELFLSEKTIARHVSNIFTKLGVSCRAAATAYAIEHDLV